MQDLCAKQKQYFTDVYKLLGYSLMILVGRDYLAMTALRKKNIITWNTGAARSVRIIDSYYLEHCAVKFPAPTETSQEPMDNASSGEFTVTSQKTQIPILGKIAAGAPLTVAEQSDETLELDSYYPDGCYALRVKGESMIDALIADGDLVLIEPRQSAYDGEIVVALVDNDGATLKRFFKEDGGMIRLQPENPTMDPIMIDPRYTDLNIQGIVKGVIRRV